MPIRLAIVVGARPNLVKAAPLLRSATQDPAFECTVVHTGQHFDKNMSEIFFQEMDIPEPDIIFEHSSGSVSERVGRTYRNMIDYFSNHTFDAVVVFGDVNSTLAGSLGALCNKTKLIHIEAGLRSHDRRMPEEVNRVIVDHIADLLFTTEASANENLRLEGIPDQKVCYVGNLMIESLLIYQRFFQDSEVLKKLALEPRSYVVVTVHRPENVEDSSALEKIFSVLGKLSHYTKVVLPLHPWTKQKISQYNLEHLLAPLTVIEPQGYFEFIKLVSDSRGVVTDSGGIQEETTHLRVPCATIRENTERPVTVELGSNQLFYLQDPEILEKILAHLASSTEYKNIPLWDEQVSQRILARLKDFLA